MTPYFHKLTNTILLKAVTTLRLSSVRNRTFTLKSDQIHAASVLRLPVWFNLIFQRLAGCSPQRARPRLRCTRDVPNCVTASKQLLLPTLQPGCKRESKRNNKQTTDINCPFTFIPLTIPVN